MNELTTYSPVTWVFGGLIVMLLVASCAIGFKQYRQPQANLTELWLRIRSWWVMVIIFVLALSLNQGSALILFAFISFVALKEFLSIIPTRRADRRVLFWVYLAIPIQYFWIADAWYGMFIIFIPVYVFLLLPLRMIIIGETRDFLRAVGTLHWGVMITVFCISHVAYLLVLPEEKNPLAGGVGLVLFLVVLTQLNDVAQYLWGKSLGKRKILPKVSPNKTWEGFYGGIGTTAVLAMLLAPWLTPMNTGYALLAGLLIGVAGFVGDVTLSALKRDLGLKDSGNLLPGHGGMLDRIDSLTYTAPLFFHFMYYFYY